MKIKEELVQEMTIEDFADQHSLTMVIRERANRKANDPDRFYAYLEHVEIKDGCILIGTYGNGKNKKEAMEDYAKQISEKLIVVNAYGPNRKEIHMPRLV